MGLSSMSEKVHGDMSSNVSFPRKRSSRITHSQVDCLTDYMMRHTTFALGLYSSLQGKDQSKMMWTDLAANLNELGTPKGIQKWQKVWSEIKSKARLKYQKFRSEHTSRVSLGGYFSDPEKKVLSIIGLDLDEVNNFPSSIAEGSQRLHLALFDNGENGLGKDDICTEVLITDETPCKVEVPDSFCIGKRAKAAYHVRKGDSHSIGCSSEEDLDPHTPVVDSVLNACDSVPRRRGQKRVSSSELDGQEESHKRHHSFLRKSMENAESSKSQHKILLGVLNAQQEMVQGLFNSQQEMMQGLLRSQQKIVQDFQSSQQEIAKSVINFMNRRADLDERAIRLEEERLKLEERKLNALSAMQKDKKSL